MATESGEDRRDVWKNVTVHDKPPFHSCDEGFAHLEID